MKKLSLILACLFVLAAVAGCSASEPAQSSQSAQPSPAEEIKFPTKTIEVVVPFNAGASVDNSIRALCACAEKYMDGEKIIISNKPGGSALVGQTYVANAEPDGYTLVALTNSFINNLFVDETTLTADSFEPVMQYCFDPSCCVAYGKAPFNNPTEMIEYAKTNEVSHATSGYGTAHHIASLLLCESAGVELKQVHTGGGSEQIANTAGGHILTTFAGYGTCVPMIETGDLKAIGICADERDPRCPDVPTFKECGYDVVYGAWRGIAAPAGTPQAVIDKLCEAFTLALNENGGREALEAIDIPVYYRDSAEFKTLIHDEYEAYGNDIIPMLESGAKD